MAPEGRRRARGSSLPKDVKSMSKEVLAATLKKKKECDARALEVVERLLEADVAEEAFLACLPLIQESHFRDVVEERAISALCGYPLCPSPLGPRSARERRYAINTRVNKVYDLTERKNFCSNLCYKSARFVKDQLLTSPLWLRDGEEIPRFTLLPTFASGGLVGDEVDIGTVPSIKQEVEKLKLDEERARSSVRGTCAPAEEGRKVGPPECGLWAEDRLSSSREDTSTLGKSNEVTQETVAVPVLRSDSPGIVDCIRDEVGEESAPIASEKVTNDDSTEGVESKVEEVCQVSQAVETWEGKTQVRGSQTVASTTSGKASFCRSEFLVAAEVTTRPSGKVAAPMEGESKVAKSSVARVETCLEEWVTVESLVLLLGEDAVREALSGGTLEGLLKSEGDGVPDGSMRETYRSICRRLNLMELEDARYDAVVAREGRELRPLPDYAAVREESLRMQLKVRAFFGGRTCYETAPPPGVAEEGGEGTCFLPLVDRHAKGALRRRMVLDRLSRVIPGLAQLLQLPSVDLTSDVREVVSTFALEAHNITFKPPEWNLLGLVLLKMISLKNAKVRSALESETARGHASGILSVFGQPEGYLEGLLARLVDAGKVLGKVAAPKG